MTNDFENQLDNIRVELYMGTKAMANNDIAQSTNENAKRIAKQYGIKIIKGIPSHVKKSSRSL